MIMRVMGGGDYDDGEYRRERNLHIVMSSEMSSEYDELQRN